MKRKLDDDQMIGYHGISAGMMLGQRQRRWTNIIPGLEDWMITIKKLIGIAMQNG